MTTTIGTSVGNPDFQVTIPSILDPADIVEAFKYYHVGSTNGSTQPGSIKQYLIDINARALAIENLIGYSGPTPTVNTRLNNLQTSVNNLGGTYIKAQPTSNDTLAERNIISPPTGTIIPLIIRGSEAGQTADLQVWRSSGGSTIAKVDSDGYLYSYSSIDGVDPGPYKVLTQTGSEVVQNKIYVSSIVTTASTSYTISASDRSKIIQFTSASAKTVNIPVTTDSLLSPGIPIGTSIVINNLSSSGNITISPAVGVSLYAQDDFFLVFPYGSATLTKTGSSTWVKMDGGGGTPKAVVSSATVSPTPVTIGGIPYNLYIFNGSGSINFSKSGLVDVLVIGPGGGSGVNGGGGGGGGFIEGYDFWVNASSYPVAVGAGGGHTAFPSSAGPSSSFASMTSVCGGAGSGYFDRPAGAGASGGGGGYVDGRTGTGGTNGSGMEYQGAIGATKSGGNGGVSTYGGGGGAGGHASGGSPGAPAYSSITGTSTAYCGGGSYGSGSGPANSGYGGGYASGGGSGRVIVRVRV